MDDESLKSDGTASTAESSGCSVVTEKVTRESDRGGRAASKASREAENDTIRTLELSVFEATGDDSVVSSLVSRTTAAGDESPHRDGSDGKREENVESAIHYFYSALKAGTVVVMASMLPLCMEEEEETTRETMEEEGATLPGRSAMDLLGASSDEESRRSRENRNAQAKAHGGERSRQNDVSRAEEKQEARERARSKSSHNDDGGGDCLSFSCLDDDISQDEDQLNGQPEALLNEGLEEMKGSLSSPDLIIKKRETDPFVKKMATEKQYLLMKRNRALILEHVGEVNGQLEALLNERLEDMEDSLSNLDLIIKKRHTDPLAKKMATAKQYLLMKRQRALILEHVGEDHVRRDAWRSRLRQLGRNIEARRADVRRMKVKLESVGVDNDEWASGRSSPRDDGDNDDDEVVGIFYREEEEELDMIEAFRVFAGYTAGRLDVLQRKGLWRMMVDD